jgi:hypothetical protein
MSIQSLDSNLKLHVMFWQIVGKNHPGKNPLGKIPPFGKVGKNPPFGKGEGRDDYSKPRI